MKKFAALVSTGIASLFLVATVGVSAVQNASINTTGPGSNNVITYRTTDNINVTCTNTTNVDNNTNQNSTSGSANTSGNTSAGGATSGSATNNSNVSSLVNGGCPTGFVPTTTTSTPVAGGGSGGAVVPSTKATTKAAAPAAGAARGAAVSNIAALPNTGPNTVVTGVAATAAGVGTLAALVYVAMGAYRRYAFKA